MSLKVVGGGARKGVRRGDDISVWLMHCSGENEPLVLLDSLNGKSFGAVGQTVSGACCSRGTITSFSFLWVRQFLNVDTHLFLKVN